MRSNRRATREGNFLLLFAVSSTVILGFGALSIDISYLRNSQMELQNAVDAAAHAALIAYRTGNDQNGARQVAKDIARANRVAGKPLSLSDDDIIFGTWDFDSRAFGTSGSFVNAVQVNGRRLEGSTDGPINYFLGPILGTAYGEARSSATGAFRFREMMLVLDTTGSFFRDIDNGRNAVLSFLDRIHDNHLPQDKLGLMTFAQQTSLISRLQDVETGYTAMHNAWYGEGDVSHDCRTTGTGTLCLYYNRSYGLNICFKDIQPDGTADAGAPFNQKFFDVAQTMPNLNCYDGSAYTAPRTEGTNHAVALEGAIDELLDNGIAGNQKVIVLVSDGRAQCKQPDDSSTQDCVTTRQHLAFDQAERASELGVSIFSVMYCSNCDTGQLAAAEAYSSNLVAGVGKSYTTRDSDQLDDILNEIADSLPVALVQ